jgi:hypothetical protein
MLDARKFSVDDVWRRVRVLFENGQVSAARRTLRSAGGRDARRALLNWRHGAQEIAASPPEIRRARDAEMVLFAVVRLAAPSPTRRSILRASSASACAR